ncbi:MAG: hypothetical protein XXXNARYT_001188 [Candidatus Accumulibacter regalis]
MIVVLPSVSTAVSLRMIARRLAIRATPMASVMVIAAGSPSGIAPTASATAAMNISKAEEPRHIPTTKVSTASRPMAISSQLLKTAILRVRGVVRSGASAINCEMRPVSVWSPVATTTPAPRPVIITVPA